MGAKAESQTDNSYTQGRFLLALLIALMVIGALGFVVVVGGVANKTQTEHMTDLAIRAAEYQRESLDAQGRFSFDADQALEDANMAQTLERIDGGQLVFRPVPNGISIQTSNSDGLRLEVDLDSEGKVDLSSCPDGWVGGCPQTDVFDFR